MASVDVLLPFYVFGDHACLTRAVDSVYRQSLPPRQLLILVNGGKHHERVSCIERLVALVRPSHPLGLQLINCAYSGISAALNYGLSMSDADFVSRLDADDVMLPGRHRFMLDYLDSCRTEGLSVPDVLGTPVLVDGSSSSGVIGRLSSKPTTDASIRLNLLWGNPFAHPAVLLRRQLVVDVGGYRPIKAAEDLDLWLRLARWPGVTFANLSIPLTRYTLAPGSLSHSPDSFLGSAHARLRNIKNPADLLLHSPKIGFDLARYLLARLSCLGRR
jgi:glycosyltransferase involved in cell wall biosynthesis